MSGGNTMIRLVLADEGVFHEETIQLSEDTLAKYDRLIDLLQEDSDLLKRYHIDLDRLVIAEVVADDLP